MRNLLSPLIVLIAMLWPQPKALVAPVFEPNPLQGKRLRYLIGNDGRQEGHKDEVTEVAYWSEPALHGISIGYCNLFDEEGTNRFGPYRPQTDTAIEYKELVPDPDGPGFEANLREQFARRKKQGFTYVELDNPDAYRVADVVGAVHFAAGYGLQVVAKNPLIMEGDPTPYVALSHAVIVERGAGNPRDMNALRVKAGQPNMQIWFVSFGSGASWAMETYMAIRRGDYRNMHVTHSTAGEYGNSVDVP